jgi:hypothetical protein
MIAEKDFRGFTCILELAININEANNMTSFVEKGGKVCYVQMGRCKQGFMPHIIRVFHGFLRSGPKVKTSLKMIKKPI